MKNKNNQLKQTLVGLVVIILLPGLIKSLFEIGVAVGRALNSLF